LKEELRRILPQVEEMRKRKSDRRNQFLEVQGQIQEISNEIYGSSEYMSSKMVVDDSDLSLRKLEELHRKLHELQKEKVELFYYFFLSIQFPFHQILLPII
jgi:protein regulator of cytokinesis 1